MTAIFRTENGPSLFLQCLAYKAMGHVGQIEDAPLKRDEIPPRLLKPTHGPCVHCLHDTEDRHGGEWMHVDCNDALVAEQREDYRLDSPTHTPYGRR